MHNFGLRYSQIPVQAEPLSREQIDATDLFVAVLFRTVAVMERCCHTQKYVQLLLPDLLEGRCLLLHATTKDLSFYEEEQIRLRIIGRREGLSDKLQVAIEEAETKTAMFTKGQMNICINYGGRAEIVDAVKEIVEGDPVKLLESVAESIAASLLGKFTSVDETTVKVINPDPPIPGHYASVAVEITRGRS